MDYHIKPQIFISHREIKAVVSRLAGEISNDYQDKSLMLISILKGSFIFLADLMRSLELPLEIEFVKLSSYGNGRESPGNIKMVHGLDIGVSGKYVLVVEDIIDTGLTTNFFLDYLRQKQPSSIKICALMSKPSRRKFPVNIDYLGFTVPDKFLVGYGLDCDEKYRNLPDICFIE